MDAALKVTDAPEESSFADLVSGDNVLSIPLFQRPYRWNQKHLTPLVEDIENIRDEIANSVFLGVIVSYSRGSGPGRPVTWEVVDGQQRITTLYLSVMAAAEVAAKRGHPSWASDVIGSYLLVRPLASNPINTKLVPSYADRSQFAAIWTRIADIPELRAIPAFTYNAPMPPPASGSVEGAMSAQYVRLRREMARINDEHGHEALERFVEIIVRRLSFVSISLRDPAVAPKIFERLNARAEPVTIADLVRNEIFSRSGENAIHAQHVFNTYWEPFVANFKAAGTDLEKFLFPYGLLQNPNVRKADLFPQLRLRWGQLGEPKEIIAELDKFRPTFLALESAVPDPQISSTLNNLLNRLHRVGRPSSLYAFIMRLIDAFRKGEILEESVADVLSSLESFLFRRAVLGIEPTGLHAAFKGLWNELVKADGAASITGASLKAAVAAKPTIAWPTDAQFRDAIRTQDLYHRKVVHFALREHELSLKGETPDERFDVEHIAPQVATDHWKEAFGEKYASLVHTWGNLIPLSSEMNPAVGQKPYSEKRAAFANSKFANARDVALNNQEWTPNSIEARNETIANWAVTRWPY